MTKFLNEKQIYDFWEKENLFWADSTSSKKPYSLLIPPPNLTGELHLGHAMQHSILDAIARFKRMQDFDVLLLPGVDHAGILFESTFDRELAKEGLSKVKLGREEWLKRAWQFKEKIYHSVSSSWRMMGLSADWSREVFTLDPGPQRAVFEEFKTYFERGLIYKGPYIVQWCPKCNTAIEAVELEYEERDEKLYFVRYLIERTKDKYIEVATTRPETIFADSGIAVYPNHPKFKKYIGRKVQNPLIKNSMPIFEDERVDRKFGTGALKVTPGHDLLDYQIGKDHNLEIRQVVDKSGRMTALAGDELNGLKVIEAREKVIELLKLNNSLESIKPYKHSVAVCERCKSVIEPLISEEWFVKVDDLAKEAIKAIKAGKINFLPKNYAKILIDWLSNIHDWCISRQLWWGHQIPIWYCQGNLRLARPLGFAKDVIPQLFNGKTKTYRLRDHWYRVGDKIAFHETGTEKIIGLGKITDVEKTSVDKLKLDDSAHWVKYEKREDLILALKKHNPGFEVNKNTVVYSYSFEFKPIKKSVKECGDVFVSFNKPKKCPRCGNTKVEQDPNTLDTWFSSSLWPLSTLGWASFTKVSEAKPSDKVPCFNPELAKYYPWDFEITAPEIKYLWIARMIMIGQYFAGDVPFRTMFFHGMLRDLLGRKFSKSLGNGIEPIYLIDRWGVDATRMALYTYSIPGRDGRVSREILDERGKNFRNFSTKIRNIAKFILELKPETARQRSFANAQDDTGEGLQNDKKEHADDKWIKDQLDETVKSVTKNLGEIKLHLASEQIYDFIWHKFADIYIEKSKKRRSDAQPVLEYVLEVSLIILHPFMPFVTEEIYQKLSDKKKSIMLEEWPIIKSPNANRLTTNVKV